MLAPISWLKDFVEIKLPLKDLMWKMTEAGLTCESYNKIDGEIVLGVEVTANRPDWMSIIGIAREIAAIQGIKIKEPEIINLPKPQKTLKINLKTDYKLYDRWSGLVISDIKIKPSPDWIQKRLKLVNLRPINNIVDITNYLMWELGIPMHAFDYDSITGKQMTVGLAKGGEKFTTVDEVTYKLPKNAMIIRDSEKIIDLVGIKGGLNSGIKNTTKNIFVHVTINNPVLIRKASAALGLRSEASAIYERGPDKGGTPRVLNRVAKMILDISGGQIASQIIDLKEKPFGLWKLELSLSKLNKVLGIILPNKEIIDILTKLNLSPKKSGAKIVCIIPTYRADLKIEEDLIEEIARIYGYNKFPKTLPLTRANTIQIPYFFDDLLHLKLKNLLVSAGYTEAMTLSLLSKELTDKCLLDISKHIKIANPVSIDYEYLRTSIIPNLLMAVKSNTEETTLQLFELGKVITGKPGKTDEPYKLGVIANNVEFTAFKGIVDLILNRFNIDQKIFSIKPAQGELWHSTQSCEYVHNGKVLLTYGLINHQVLKNLDIEQDVYALDMDMQTLERYAQDTKFKSLPKYPAQIEDMTIVLPEQTKIGGVINFISSIDKSVVKVELRDVYKDAYTFRTLYQNPDKTLTNEEVEIIRNKIITAVKIKFGGIIKG